MKKLEFINAPIHIHLALDLFRRCMSQKLRERVFVTKESSTVESNLPPELGGNGPHYDELAERWKNITQDKVTWFAEQEYFKLIV